MLWLTLKQLYWFRRKQAAAVCWFFSPCSIQWLWLTQEEKPYYSKQSHPYLGDCHGLLLVWVTRHLPFKKQPTLNLRDGPQLDPNVTSPVWIMRLGVGKEWSIHNRESDLQQFPALLFDTALLMPFHPVSSILSVCCLTLCLAWDKYNDEVTGLDCK